MTEGDAGPSTPRPSSPPLPAVASPSKPRRTSWFGISLGAATLSPAKVATGVVEHVEHLPPMGSEHGVDVEGDTVDGAATVSGRGKHRKRRSRGSQGDIDSETIRLEDLSAYPTARGPDVSTLAHSFLTLEDSPLIPRPRISPRTSSMLTEDPPTPIPIVDQERPLPPIPPHPPPHDTPLVVPRGIVITPSSPQKANFEERLTSSEAMALRTRSRSRSISPARLKSPIGLGLPRMIHPDLESTADTPPSLPIKPQVVSSPLPSSSGTSTPIVSFANSSDERPGAPRRGRLLRARSLSNVLARVETTPSSPSGTDTPASREEDAPTSGSSGGVLGWLGLRRTVKRRPSSVLTDSPADPEVPYDEKGHYSGKQSLGLEEEILRDDSNRDDTVRGPLVTRDVSLGSITAMDIRDDGQNPVANHQHLGPQQASSSPIPIPRLSSSATASSSRSSFSLPPIETDKSALLPPDSPWMSSPTSDDEPSLSADRVFDSVDSKGPLGVSHRATKVSLGSSLHLLPEHVAFDITPQMSASLPKETRLRSWSDASQASPQRPHFDASPTDNGTTARAVPAAGSSPFLEPSPLESPRPPLGPRANSGSAALLDRMKSVFGRSSSRNRAGTLDSRSEDFINEFGAIAISERPGRLPRPAQSISSATSPESGASPSLQATQNGTGALDVKPSNERLPRAIITPQRSGSIQPDPQARPARHRPRASTVSFAPSPSSLMPPPSATFMSVAATPPRRRPSAFSRISTSLLRSGPSSPRSPGLFPLPARSTGSPASDNISSFAPWDEHGSSGMLTPGASPRPSIGSVTAAMTGFAARSIVALKEGETPDQWIERLAATVGPGDIAGILASRCVSTQL